jgi:hypothetical protein
MGDGLTIRLSTSRLTEGETYAVTINGVRDLAVCPNAVAANTTTNIRHSLAGYVLREVWTGIPGVEIQAMVSHTNYPAMPAVTEKMTSIEASTNWGDNYGTRIRGYVRPAVSGEYTFWIAADDSAELWLSPDQSVEKKALIAKVPGWTKAREWDKAPAQKSARIALKAGAKYYIEALHKEYGGGDHVSVAWEGPGIARGVIPGSVLLLP